MQINTQTSFLTGQHQNAFFGFRWNPFLSSIPVEGTEKKSSTENLILQTQLLIQEGGFSLLIGEAGTGKTIILRQLEKELSLMNGVSIQIISRPQNTLTDFYREMAEMGGFPFNHFSSFHGFKTLRGQWQQHVKEKRMRPLLIIDEAQECSDLVLNELRLLSYTSLDSQIVLSVILAGDKRLDEKLRKKNLIPLLSRVRYRFEIPSQSSEELLMMLNEVLEKSGNAQLMSEGLKKIVTEKSLGNPRAMMNIGQKLLLYAQQKQQNKLTEELWIEINKP